ncbi:MAG: hypothetical protein HZB13_21425 [Acidobacteria bacterium]|nr:hypothetical protein [Acidobacteriota bacterium]
MPLEAGNQWTYKGPSGGFSVEVAPPVVFAGNEYYLVSGFPSQPRVWLRKDAEGRILMWDAESRSEKMWLDTVASDASTGVDPCNSTSHLESREAKYAGPVGEFNYGLLVRYATAQCADAGVESDYFLPSVGILRRSMQTIAGPRVFDLVYARLGTATMIAAPELSFALSLDRAVYTANLMPPVNPRQAIPVLAARFTLRNTTGAPIELQFGSGQTYDVVIRNAEGRTVYQWSDGQGFTQALRTERFSGERNWLVSIPLATADRPLPAGRYTAEAWLATTGGKQYAATVGFEIRHLN